MLERSALCHKFAPWDQFAVTTFIRWIQISGREDGKQKGVETLRSVSTLHCWHGKGGWGIVCSTGERATGARTSSPVTIRPNTMARGLSAWVLGPSVCLDCTCPSQRRIWGWRRRNDGQPGPSIYIPLFPANENCCCRRSWQLQGHQETGETPWKTKASVWSTV